MRVDDVIFEYGAPGSRSLGAGNFQTLMNHLQGRRTSRDLRLDLGNDKEVEIDDDDLDHIIAYYNSLANAELKKDFAYGVMSRSSRLIALLDKLGIKYKINQGTQSGLLEDKKKGAEPELSRDTVRDPKLAVALRKAYASQPSARSDIEALIRQDIDAQASTQDDLQRQTSINRRQEQNLETLRNLARKQSQLLKNLDSENSDQNREIDGLEQEIKDLANKSIDRSEKSRSLPSRIQGPSGSSTPDTSAAADEVPSKSDTTKAEPKPAQGSTKKTEPFEPTIGGAPIPPVKPKGPGPRGAALKLPYEPSPSRVPPYSVAPVTPITPMARASTDKIDLLPQVPDLDDQPSLPGRRSELSLSPSPELDYTAANDEEIPAELQRRVAEDQYLGRLITLSGIK